MNTNEINAELRWYGMNKMQESLSSASYEDGWTREFRFSAIRFGLQNTAEVFL